MVHNTIRIRRHKPDDLYRISNIAIGDRILWYSASLLGSFTRAGGVSSDRLRNIVLYKVTPISVSTCDIYFHVIKMYMRIE